MSESPEQQPVRALQPPFVGVAIIAVGPRMSTSRERARLTRMSLFGAIVSVAIGTLGFTRVHDRLDTVLAIFTIITGLVTLAVVVARAIRGFDRAGGGTHS